MTRVGAFTTIYRLVQRQDVHIHVRIRIFRSTLLDNFTAQIFSTTRYRPGLTQSPYNTRRLAPRGMPMTWSDRNDQREWSTRLTKTSTGYTAVHIGGNVKRLGVEARDHLRRHVNARDFSLAVLPGPDNNIRTNLAAGTTR